MKNKNIMFVTGSLADGGAEKVMSILASGCAELGANVSIVVLRDKNIVYPLSNSVKVIQFKDSGKLVSVKRIWKLHRVLKGSEADAVIPFLPIISLYTIIANIGVGKKLIMSERADPYAKLKRKSWKDKVGDFLMRKCGLFGLAKWVVFQTADAKAFYGNGIQRKSCIIPNPLDITRLPLRYTEIRDKRIVAAGRFSEEKNFPLLINGFAKFHSNHQDYRLVIYGDGGLRSVFLEQIKALHVEDFVSLPGFVSNLPEQMNKAAMYVSTSNHEGISNVMLEALGMGVPTIVTDCPIGGARMFVNNNVNGLLIPMNDEAQLINALNKIADEPEFANELSTSSIRIREELRADNICKRWLELV